MNGRFTVMEDRIDRLATHVDGFMKLHEVLDKRRLRQASGSTRLMAES